MAKTYKTLTYEVNGHVAKLTLNRPELLNRLDDEATAEIVDILEGLRRPKDVRVLVFASTGKAFSAGGDLNEVLRLAEDREARDDAWEMGRRVIYAMANVSVPVVLSLQGDTYGLGTSIAMGADITVAWKDALICDPHVKVGLVAGDGGIVVWPAAIGFSRAKRHLLTGDPIKASDAFALGGVSDLVDTPEECLPLAEKLASKIAALPPIAVQFTKRSLNHLQTRQVMDSFEFSMALEQFGMQTDDLKEAVASFKEKRKPVYKNR